MRFCFSQSAEKVFLKLDKHVRLSIEQYIHELENLDDPRVKGKFLTGNMSGLWRFRYTDYRIICDIHDDEAYVIIVRIGHRRDVCL